MKAVSTFDGGTRPASRRIAFRWFPWSLPAAALVVATALASTLAVVVFRPTVNAAEIQRRDRLPSQARFVDFTYRYFLDRSADDAGLADYVSQYDRSGPVAVVVAILQSPEFRAKHPDGKVPHADVLWTDTSQQSDVAVLASQYVRLYDSGDLDSASSDDGAGRVGFVLVAILAGAAIVCLQRLSQRSIGGTSLHTYLPQWYVVGLFSALAVVWSLNSQALLSSFAAGSIGYAEWLNRLTSLSMLRGVTNVWTPYPQGTQMLLVGLASTANSLAAALHSDVWTSYTLFRWLFQIAFLLVPSVLLVSLAYKLGMLLSPASATIASTIVAFSFAPVYYGVVSTLVTDPLAVSLEVLAIWLLLRNRSVWAGIALGVGAGLKLFPLLILLPALVVGARNSRVRLLLATGAVIAAIFLPFLTANADMFWSPFRWQTGRPPWESWYALINWLVGAPHEYSSPAFEDIGVGHDFGWVFWGITPTLTSLVSPVQASPARWDNVLSGFGTVLSLLAVFTARSSGHRALIRWSLYALCVTFFWGIGWSPQYELYVLPLVALAFEAPFVGVAAAIGLEVLTFLEYPLLLPWAYFYGGSTVWLAWSAILARYMLLAWIAVWVVRTEGSIEALRRRLSTVRRVLDPGLRRARRVAVIGGLVGASIPFVLGAAPRAQDASVCGGGRGGLTEVLGSGTPLDWSLPTGWFFTQAGETQDHGYAIADDDSAQMWSEYNRLGGWRALGFPASRRFVWHGLLSQATQRAVLQWSPVTGQVEFANVLDLMHDEGRDDDLRHLKQIPPPMDLDEAGLPYEAIAARRLAWLDTRPAIKAAYCNTPGGADPVQLWGLPTAQVVNVSDRGGEVYVLRTQRAAFQEWVGGAPWAAPGEVTVVLAGDLAKEFMLLPAEAVVPEAAPTRG